MQAEVFQIRAAQNRVDEYDGYEEEFRHKDLMQHCAEAEDCRNLEDFLKLGIEAFDWVERADLWLRGSLARGTISKEEGDRVSDVIDSMCKGWLKPCTFAKAWVSRVMNNGYHVDNLEQFMECCRQMNSIVGGQGTDTETMSDALVGMETEALTEHRNGETAEFV